MPIFPNLRASGIVEPGKFQFVSVSIGSSFRIGLEVVTALAMPPRLIGVLHFGRGTSLNDFVSWNDFMLYVPRKSMTNGTGGSSPVLLYWSEKVRDLKGVRWEISSN